MGKYNFTTERMKEAAEKAAKGEFTILPEGDHLIRVTSVTYKLLPSSGNEALELQMTVVPGEPNQHETCRDTLVFSEKAMGRVLLALRALGVPNEALAAFDPEDPAHQKAIEGRTAIINVVHSKPDAKNRTWANVSYAGYRSASASAVDEMRKSRGGTGSAAGGAGAAIGGAADPLGDIPF